jgi:hypothetical protein
MQLAITLVAADPSALAAAQERVELVLPRVSIDVRGDPGA